MAERLICIDIGSIPIVSFDSMNGCADTNSRNGKQKLLEHIVNQISNIGLEVSII